VTTGAGATALTKGVGAWWKRVGAATTFLVTTAGVVSTVVAVMTGAVGRAVSGAGARGRVYGLKMGAAGASGKRGVVEAGVFKRN